MGFPTTTNKLLVQATSRARKRNRKRKQPSTAAADTEECVTADTIVGDHCSPVTVDGSSTDQPSPKRRRRRRRRHQAVDNSHYVAQPDILVGEQDNSRFSENLDLESSTLSVSIQQRLMIRHKFHSLQFMETRRRRAATL